MQSEVVPEGFLVTEDLACEVLIAFSRYGRTKLTRTGKDIGSRRAVRRQRKQEKLCAITDKFAEEASEDRREDVRAEGSSRCWSSL